MQGYVSFKANFKVISVTEIKSFKRKVFTVKTCFIWWNYDFESYRIFFKIIVKKIISEIKNGSAEK